MCMIRSCSLTRPELTLPEPATQVEASIAAVEKESAAMLAKLDAQVIQAPKISVWMPRRGERGRSIVR